MKNRKFYSFFFFLHYAFREHYNKRKRTCLWFFPQWLLMVFSYTIQVISNFKSWGNSNATYDWLLFFFFLFCCSIRLLFWQRIFFLFELLYLFPCVIIMIKLKSQEWQWSTTFYKCCNNLFIRDSTFNIISVIMLII